MSSSPALGADGTIYLGGADGVVWMLDPTNPNRWTSHLKLVHGAGRSLSSPVIGPDGTLVVAGGGGYLLLLTVDRRPHLLDFFNAG